MRRKNTTQNTPNNPAHQTKPLTLKAPPHNQPQLNPLMKNEYIKQIPLRISTAKNTWMNWPGNAGNLQTKLQELSTIQERSNLVGLIELSTRLQLTLYIIY
jgi:hypothetical protein